MIINKAAAAYMRVYRIRSREVSEW